MSHPVVINPGAPRLLAAAQAWLEREPAVLSAVLFGSSALPLQAGAVADAWSDFDLHVIARRAAVLEQVDWAAALPSESFRFSALRPATGGMRKLTLLFATGQLDIVIVPLRQLRSVQVAMVFGRHRRPGPLRTALNEMNTCIRGGYRFLKGERRWAGFYQRVAAEFPGVRLGDAELIALAGVTLADLLWIFQKLERGELSAAQNLLHRSVAETNFRLIRELRLRRGERLPSFGLARRIEVLLTPEQRQFVEVDARLRRDELHAAAWRAHDGFVALARELMPHWRLPPGMEQLLAVHRTWGARS